MSPAEQSAAALTRIAAALEKIVMHLASHAPPAPPGEEVASDADLDGQYGDPLIKRDPSRWSGESFANQHMSDASPDYLDALAEFFAWKAAKNTEDAATETDAVKKQKLAKYAKYARIDAARARGWARRKRSGWEPRRPAEEDSAGGADDFNYGANAESDAGEVQY